MPQPARTSMPLPTTHPATSSMFSGLSELVQKVSSEPAYHSSQANAGLFQRIASGYLNQSNEFNLNCGLPTAQKLFSSPKTFSRVQRSINSVLSAKSYVYGSNFFGKKSFYRDEFDFKKGPLHPSDRRKIRFGLKSIAAFIVQLDVENLKTCLYERDSAVAEFKENQANAISSHFSADSFFGLMDRTNPHK